MPLSQSLIRRRTEYQARALGAPLEMGSDPDA